MAHWEFPGSDPIDVFIDLAAGRIVLAAEPTDVTAVELTGAWSSRQEGLPSDVQVSFTDGRLEVTGPRRSGLWRSHAALDLAVTMPAGSRCMVRTASADVSCTGELGELDMHTASGDVTVATVTGDVAAESASGDIRLERAGGNADLRTAGGDVRLARAGGDVRVRTASGDVQIGPAAGSVTVLASSGDVRLSNVATGRAEVQTVSGDIVVGVPPGVGVYLDLSSLTGSATSQLDETGASDDVPLEVVCRAVSGDIRITKASVGDSAAGRSFSALPSVNTPEAPPSAR